MVDVGREGGGWGRIYWVGRRVGARDPEVGQTLSQSSLGEPPEAQTREWPWLVAPCAVAGQEAALCHATIGPLRPPSLARLSCSLPRSDFLCRAAPLPQRPSFRSSESPGLPRTRSLSRMSSYYEAEQSRGYCLEQRLKSVLNQRSSGQSPSPVIQRRAYEIVSLYIHQRADREREMESHR